MFVGFAARIGSPVRVVCVQHPVNTVNLASVQAFSTRAAAVGRALCPARILLSGVEYDAAIPEPRREADLDPGGEIETGELICRLALAAHPATPAEHIPLRWKRPGETDWRPTIWVIRDVRRHPIDVEWVLTCTPRN